MDELTADNIIDAIRQVLSGQMTQPQLGKWAHRALLNAYNGVHPFVWRDEPEISHILIRLMALDEGREFEVSAAELDSVIEPLSQLSSARSS